MNSTISSSPNLDFPLLAYLSSSLLYPIGNNTTLSHPFSCKSRISSIADLLNHPIGQASILFSAKNDNRFPRARCTCSLAQFVSWLAELPCRNPFNIPSSPVNSSLLNPVFFITLCKYFSIRWVSIIFGFAKTSKCELSEICDWFRAWDWIRFLFSLFSTIKIFQGCNP